MSLCDQLDICQSLKAKRKSIDVILVLNYETFVAGAAPRWENETLNKSEKKKKYVSTPFCDGNLHDLFPGRLRIEVEPRIFAEQIPIESIKQVRFNFSNATA